MRQRIAYEGLETRAGIRKYLDGQNVHIRGAHKAKTRPSLVELPRALPIRSYLANEREPAMKPLLSVSALKELFIYIPTTGDIFRNDDERFDWDIVNGYYCISVGGRRYKAHRIAWALYYGSWPIRFIDHINRDRSDNRIANLRDVSKTTNSQNTLQSTGKLYPRGVYKTYTGEYAAHIYVGGARIDLQSLCRFDTPEEAFAFYELAKQAVHPGYVKL